MSRTMNVALAGAVLEVDYYYSGPYRGSETDPPEPASVEIERVGIAGIKGSDLLDYLKPSALAWIEEQIMEAREDD